MRISDQEWEKKAEQAEYSVEALADLVPCSITQVERFFKEKKKIAPHAWMTLLRMTRAAEGLRKDDMVKEAAYKAGYKTVAHFCREFKKVHGITPSQAAYGAVSRLDRKSP